MTSPSATGKEAEFVRMRAVAVSCCPRRHSAPLSPAVPLRAAAPTGRCARRKAALRASRRAGLCPLRVRAFQSSASPGPPGGGSGAMRINQSTALQGRKVTLVPYSPAHVARYHEWMQSEELQRLTASEPLSLEQEYEMQRSWRDDADKCTFIVLDTERWSEQARGDEECMVGDVNLFLTDTEDPTLGEIEIMIAEPSYRGRGFGKEATLMMMSYGVTDLGITKFEAKIGQENEASIRMFKKLHFKEVSVNSVFQEVTLRLDVSDQERQWLLDQTKHVKKKSYIEEKLPAGVLDADR